MNKEVSFNVSLVAIPEDFEGAARILAQIAKPRNVTAVMKKLRDYLIVLEGGRPPNNRSREQVLDAASLVWGQVRHAMDVGDWFDKMFMAKNRFMLDPGEPARSYAKSLVESLEGRDPQTTWKPFLPVAHMAAGFRCAMFKTERGRHFGRGSIPRSLQMAQLRDLLLEDHGWLRIAVEAAEARMVLPRVAGMQIPAETRHFILTEPKSQESTPGSQNGLPA